MVAEIQTKTGATLVHPYDHADIILGQGTAAWEFERQVKDMTTRSAGEEREGFAGSGYGPGGDEGLDCVVVPCGGGGLLSGTATALAETGIAVFGAEPSYQGADDCCRGLKAGRRVESVASLTIADGVRTPVGVIPWSVISDRRKVKGVFAVSEEEIVRAMRLLFERGKVVVEPSAAVPVTVVLFCEEWRRLVEREQAVSLMSGGDTGMCGGVLTAFREMCGMWGLS